VRDRDFYPSVYQPKLGIADEVALMLEGMGGACLGLFFGRRKGRFAARELDRLRLVFPAVLGFHKAHLGRLFARLVEKARPRPAEPFAQPTLIVTRAGDPIYSNRAWRKALRSDPGIARAVDELTAARSKRLRLPSGVLRIDRLDREFALAPGGRMYTLETASDGAQDAKAARQATADFERLTPREREIVRLIIAGTGAADIAKRLRLSKGTVKNHRQRIYKKLGLSSERALFMRFLPLAEGLSRP
jgi:DNA-binding CsgD family transcriptional regulator